MRFKLELVWNGTIVMTAQCSAALAYSTIQSFMLGNFTGKTTREKERELPTLAAISESNPFAFFSACWADETGAAMYTLVCVE